MTPRLILAATLAVPLCPGALTAQALASAHDSAVHVLNRLAYGPLPGQVDAVSREGVWHWVERQLDPESIDNGVLEVRESDFTLLAYSRDELSREFLALQRERRERQAMVAQGDTAEAIGRGMVSDRGRHMRRLAGQVGQLVVVRATVSNRQLHEVMVDFWTNHFNVYLAKGLDRVLLPGYIEETIRPNAMGNFGDLLLATARDPAMLFYLDNVQSVAPGSMPPELVRRLERMSRSGRRANGTSGARMDSLLRQVEARLPRGLNENYARELLELHTVGVDAGYTQQDVEDVARILTGWSLSRRDDRLRYHFNAWAHDAGEKWVMGERFPEGEGEQEGRRLLAMLARHPATMHHVSRKLCARFVSDQPSPGCVDAAVAAWRRSDGDIPTILRAMFRTPEFWAESNRGAKVKSPLEFTVSAVRVLGGSPDDSPGMARVVGQLGQPLYLQAAPTGYPETQEDWVNSGALLNRMNVAMSLAGNSLRGVTIDLTAVVPLAEDTDQLIDAVDDRLLGGRMSATTRAVLRRELESLPDVASRRALAVGLAIGGPEFQRQ
jgi:uncharacterized protein (DUF1800 family)